MDCDFLNEGRHVNAVYHILGSKLTPDIAFLAATRNACAKWLINREALATSSILAKKARFCLAGKVFGLNPSDICFLGFDCMSSGN